MIVKVEDKKRSVIDQESWRKYYKEEVLSSNPIIFQKPTLMERHHAY